MKTIHSARVKIWTIVVGPEEMHAELHSLAVEAARHKRVRVVDCGGWFNTWLVGQELGGQDPDAIMEVIRPFDCHHLLQIFREQAEGITPMLLLDFLHPFYDTTVGIQERRRVLRECLRRVSWMEKTVKGVLCVDLPWEYEPHGDDLLNIVLRAAGGGNLIQIPATVREFEPLRFG